MNKEIAVLIPAYNEEITIKKVIEDFKHELPDAKIYVYNNNSKDNTREIALSCNITVVDEIRQGKGNVVRSMFKDIDADIYVMVDADDTYPAEAVHDLIKPIIEDKADMVIGDRLTNGTYTSENKRNFHNFGNNLVKFIISTLYKTKLTDIMTGYRVFNKKFVKGIPITSKGFEIETEITLHSLDKNYRILQIPINYRDRPKGSVSKLNTVNDGIKVLFTIVDIYKNHKPFYFFGILSVIFLLTGLMFGTMPIYEYITTQYITKVPLTILTTLCVIISMVFFAIAIILDVIIKQNKENYELLMKVINKK